ncbi:MAG: hypothetical protein HFI75_14640 [Lachnospiraceae bacterium]|nr:hypothetical protein [Lachnospiraceae bacterium]
MNDNIIICPKCIEEFKKVPYTNLFQYRGIYHNFQVPENCLCHKCNSQLFETNITREEFKIIYQVSHENDFILALIELKQNNIIEYQLRMSQFKSQFYQQEQVQHIVQNTKIPHCPTCNSANIKKISGFSKAGSVAMWGIFSRKVHKQWQCNDCGSEW